MSCRFVAIILAVCGLATTAYARPRTVPDQWRTPPNLAQNELTLQKMGSVVLAGIVILEPSAANRYLGALTQVEVKSLGTDRYGRQRIILFAPHAQQSIQEIVLREGAAIAYDTAATPTAWRKAETAAKTQALGIWKNKKWILSAQATPGKEGEFHYVAGTVTRTYQARDAYYLNFGDDWKTDFSIKIPRSAWRSFGKNLTVADGASVCVRGMLINENGPMMVVTRPEQLEKKCADA